MPSTINKLYDIPAYDRLAFRNLTAAVSDVMSGVRLGFPSDTTAGFTAMVSDVFTEEDRCEGTTYSYFVFAKRRTTAPELVVDIKPNEVVIAMPSYTKVKFRGSMRPGAIDKKLLLECITGAGLAIASEDFVPEAAGLRLEAAGFHQSISHATEVPYSERERTFIDKHSASSRSSEAAFQRMKLEAMQQATKANMPSIKDLQLDSETFNKLFGKVK